MTSEFIDYAPDTAETRKEIERNVRIAKKALAEVMKRANRSDDPIETTANVIGMIAAEVIRASVVIGLEELPKVLADVIRGHIDHALVIVAEQKRKEMN